VRIELIRSGGFAGIERRTECDLDAVPPRRRERLQRLIEASGLMGLPEVVGSPAPDRYQYDLAIRGDAGVRRVRVHEAAATGALLALFAELLAVSGASR